jgi:release factor glutamine methyltransferase
MSNVPKGNDAIWSIRDILNWTANYFKELDIPTPLLDAQLLLGKILQLTKIQLYMHMDRPLSFEERSQMKAFVKKRAQGEPVAYLLHQKYWHTLDLFVDSRVLIPRPETETLLDSVLGVWAACENSPKLIIDFCTGSGCLAIALAKAFPLAKVVGIDISEDALAVARENAIRNQAEVEFICKDLNIESSYAELQSSYGKADIIVANPPYVSTEEWQQLDHSVKDFEPKLALVSDKEGLGLALRIYKGMISAEMLSQNATFLMETGIGHPQKLMALLGNSKSLQPFSASIPSWQLPRSDLFVLKDLEAKDRFLGLILGLEKFSQKNANEQKEFNFLDGAPISEESNENLQEIERD